MAPSSILHLWDPNSASNIAEFTTIHTELDLKLDFENKVIVGHVVLHLLRDSKAADATHIKLDASHLSIFNVSDAQSGTKYDYSYDDSATLFGGCLDVTVPAGLALITLRIDYATTEKCSAAQWLTPNQTAGKRHPYMFTQCQAIHARTLLPCQDTPAVKGTYKARLTLPKSLNAVMSADLRFGPLPSKSSLEEEHTFVFEQTQKIPSYLIAIGAGDIKGVEIGPRSTVWSEQEILESAAWEFADTEDFIQHAEKLTIPYAWGRYDILLLPPSFPYGGMENPCLTFLTPSLLVGDRSLVSVVAHEIAHSWTGNLVTAKNWEHFWLNEGFNVFLERKILARKHGEPVRQIDSIVGLVDLRESVNHFGANHPATSLTPDLSSTNPDDVFSSVPYEKGYTLLYHLEELVGGPSFFEPYFRRHIEHFSGQSIDSDQWKSFLLEYFKEASPAAYDRLQTEVNWDAWLKEPGMPPVIPKYDQSVVTPCFELADQWLSKGSTIDENTAAAYGSKFSVDQKVLFLDTLNQKALKAVSSKGAFEQGALAKMDHEYKLTDNRNVEICLKWYQLAITCAYTAVFPAVTAFISRHGRMKYNRPLYRALYRSSAPDARQLALSTFKKHREFYHPIAAKMIAKDLEMEY